MTAFARRHALATRVAVAAGCTALATAAATWAASAPMGLPAATASAVGGGVGLGLGLLLARWALRPARMALRALSNGVAEFAESDFATRLALPSHDELGDLVDLFNRMGDVLRRERASLAQRELLLDSLLQGAPMAILLLNAGGRIVFANHAARRLLRRRGHIMGEPLGAMIDEAPLRLRGALERLEDGLVSWDDEGQAETWRVLVRAFTLHTAPHRLVMVERLTADLSRQEAQVWKKAIRVMSHEINNSLAPVSSLAHSAGIVASRSDAATRLPPILHAIAERVSSMTTFLERYARVARLPSPQMHDVDVDALLQQIGRLFPHARVGPPTGVRVRCDAGQMQQALINLIKNAEESGSPAEAVQIDGVAREDGVTFVVSDRGGGMSDEEMRTALLPFHSSKKAGGGLGLSLCAEIVEAHRGRLQMARREGGGMSVSVWLPYSSSSSSGVG